MTLAASWRTNGWLIGHLSSAYDGTIRAGEEYAASQIDEAGRVLWGEHWSEPQENSAGHWFVEILTTRRKWPIQSG